MCPHEVTLRVMCPHEVRLRVMCPHEVSLSMLCCRKCCQQENHEAQDKLDYTAKQLNLLSAEIKDKIKQMTEEVERKV